MTNSRDKGKRGEREAAKYMQALGFTARRGQQFRGGEDSPDVIVAELMDTHHIEVKRTERFSLYDAMDQAIEDAEGKIPVVMHRRNRKPWVVVLLARDYFSDYSD